MMLILKSTVSKIGRGIPVAVKAIGYGTFALSCGYGGFKFTAMILPSLVAGDAKREERLKALLEGNKEIITMQDKMNKELETRVNKLSS